jgi:hypothetical protein
VHQTLIIDNLAEKWANRRPIRRFRAVARPGELWPRPTDRLAEVPPRVEIEWTIATVALRPVCDALLDWAHEQAAS